MILKNLNLYYTRTSRNQIDVSLNDYKKKLYVEDDLSESGDVLETKSKEISTSSKKGSSNHSLRENPLKTHIRSFLIEFKEAYLNSTGTQIENCNLNFQPGLNLI